MCDGAFRIPYFVVLNEIYKVALVKSSTLMEDNIVLHLHQLRVAIG
jgi:hypothetical protein